MKKIIFLAFTGLLFTNMFGQQDAQYSQYMYNTVSVNPAYAVSKEYLSIVGLYRSQWVGLDGAPKTQTLSITSPLGKSLGGGLSIVNDQIGPANETYIDVDFAYSIRLNTQTQLAFGLKAGLNILDVNFDRLDGGDQPDQLFETNIDNRVMPNVGLGMYWYGENFYLGLSSPDLLETKHFDEEASAGESFLAKESVHAYLMGGYVLDLNPDFKFKPSFLLKVVQGAPLQVDMSANFLYREQITLGAAYRWDAAVSLLAGFQITEKILIGYAYDFETTPLKKYNSGSHELILKFDLLFREKAVISPRFF